MAHKRAACRKTIMVMVFISPVHCIFSATWRFREKQRIFCDHYRRKKKQVTSRKQTNELIRKEELFHRFRNLSNVDRYSKTKNKKMKKKWRIVIFFIYLY